MSSEGFFLGEEARREIRDFYDMSKNELGKGSYGVVKLARLRGTQAQRAIKIIDKSKVSNVERFKLEVEITMKLDHPSILRLYDYFEDAKHVYLVLELCSGGELFDRIVSNKFYNENDAKIIFSQIINAIHYCHLNGVVHRDLKPENFIMVSKKEPFLLKVIDFGLSRTFEQVENKGLKERSTNATNTPAKPKRQSKAVLKTKAGTPFYIAPEVLTGNYTEKCDVWSAGVILYILFCGYPPFYGDNNKEILEAVKKGKLDFSSPEWKDKGKLAIDILKKMITNQDQRLFSDEVISHQWMTEKRARPDGSIMKEIVRNIMKFSEFGVFKQTVAYFISRNCGEEELTSQHEAFSFFDQRKTGSITLEDFATSLKEIAGTTQEESQDLFSKLDLFELQHLSYSQFIAATRSLSDTFSSENLAIFFAISDIDKDDKLTINDVSKFIGIQFKYRKQLPEKYLKDIQKDQEKLGLTGVQLPEFQRILLPKKLL